MDYWFLKKKPVAHKTFKGYGKLYSFIFNKRIKLTKGFKFMVY